VSEDPEIEVRRKPAAPQDQRPQQQHPEAEEDQLMRDACQPVVAHLLLPDGERPKPLQALTRLIETAFQVRSPTFKSPQRLRALQTNAPTS
jgi:hypothetical protein